MSNPNVHDGLADLDAELDVGDLLADTMAGDSPVQSASKKMRTGDDSPESLLAGGQAGDEDAAEDALDDDAADAADAEGDDQIDAEDADAAEGDEDAAEDADAADTDTEEPEGFSLEVPQINDDGRKANEKVTLDGLPQEFHDLLKGHINRSQRLGEIEAQLTADRQYEVVADFVDSQPLTTMLMLDQSDRQLEQPRNVGRKFVEQWMKQYPDEGMELIRDMKFDNPSRLDPDLLKERAEVARERAEAAVRKGLQSQSSRTSVRRWANDTGGLLRGMAQELGLDADESRDFFVAASARINDASKRAERQGRDPLLDRSTVTQLVQKVVARFAGTTSPAGRKGSKRSDPATMERRHRVAERTKKIKGGKSAAPGPGLSITAKKIKGAKGVREASAVLRGK